MKHILRKLHIGGTAGGGGGTAGGGGGHELFDGRNPTVITHQDPSPLSPPPPSAASTTAAAATTPSTTGLSAWLTNARHSLRPSNSSSSPSSSSSPLSPNSNSISSPSNSTNPRVRRIESTSQRPHSATAAATEIDEGPMNFNYYEEEYQVQLALALSMSNQNEVDDPESFQIRAAKRISLGRLPSLRATPAQSTAHRYWNCNFLDYGEKVLDGFYDVYGVMSDFGTTENIPSLVHLQSTPVTGILGYEVVLVNRAIDPDLIHLEQAALCLALDCGMNGISPQSSDLVQKIADLVVQHMGGPVVDANDMHRRWVSKSYELRTSLNNIVLPLGSLKIGMSRHRALLFKVLADHVGIPCRLVKGSHYTGTDEGAVNIIKLECEREYIVDLMGAPGTLLPAEAVGNTSNIDLFENTALVEELFSQIDSAQNLLVGGEKCKSTGSSCNEEYRAESTKHTAVSSNGHQGKGFFSLSDESMNLTKYSSNTTETDIASAGKSMSNFSDCNSAVVSPLLPWATEIPSVVTNADFGNNELSVQRNQINGEDEAEIQMQNIHERLRKRRVDDVGDPVVEDVAEWEIPWGEIGIGVRIGIGSYGEVHLGDWRGMEVAVKKFLDQDFFGDALDEFISEVRIMRRMKHPNVVLFVGAVTRPPNLSIVTEYLPRGSLFRLLHRPNCQLDEKLRLRMAQDVAEGMNYLHTSKPIIVHRDLKSPNLLVDKNWVVKVCDFGLSRLKHHTFLSSRSTAGTPEWMAPEVLRNELSNEKCDVYSFGVILWELCTLQQPWSGMNPMQVVGAVGFQNRRLEIPYNVDPFVSRIISSCWQRFALD